MADVNELIRAETRLTQSFAAVALFVVLNLFAVIFMTPPSVAPTMSWWRVVLSLAQLACYVWYAIAAGGAAKALGDAGWKYVAWILIAPLTALVPIPIVASIVSLSPLSIKFLLGGRLRSAIGQASAAPAR